MRACIEDSYKQLQLGFFRLEAVAAGSPAVNSRWWYSRSRHSHCDSPTAETAMKDLSSPDAIILLLDSDSVMRAAIQDVLQSAGYLVVAAGDLGAAVDRLDEIRPDLLIVRPYINSMPGHMAATYLRTKRPGLPVLIVGGFMEDDRVDVQNAIGGYYTFPKPFGRQELLAKLTEVLNVVRKRD